MVTRAWEKCLVRGGREQAILGNDPLMRPVLRCSRGPVRPPLCSFGFNQDVSHTRAHIMLPACDTESGTPIVSSIRNIYLPGAIAESTGLYWKTPPVRTISVAMASACWMNRFSMALIWSGTSCSAL